jgi:hypothetical protein
MYTLLERASGIVQSKVFTLWIRKADIDFTSGIESLISLHGFDG